jgi:anaerobic magnesium-protoporphyrin IX monomethyl ester cyclase
VVNGSNLLIPASLRTKSHFDDIILILPPEGDFRSKMPLCPNAGVGYISEALIRNGISHQVYDLNLKNSWNQLQQRLDENAPDLIGISMRTLNYLRTYALISKIRNKAPHAKIAVGGPHISTLRAQVLQDCRAVDYGFVFEGEESFVEFVQGTPIEDVKGTLFRKDGQVHYSGDRAFISDLDKIAFPTYSKFSLDDYIGKYISIVSSRGCPYNCIYCPVGTCMGKRFRPRSPENISEEILYWYERGYRHLDFADDNFTLDRKRVQKLCQLISKHGMKDLVLTCQNGIRADKVDKPLLSEMRRVGFKSIAIGVESANNDILINIKKGETLEQIELAIKTACGLGFEVKLFFIVGSPGETFEHVKNSIDFAKKHPVTTAYFYNLIPFPGTALFKWAQKNNYLLSRPSEYLNKSSHFLNDPLIETPQFSRSERRRAFALATQASREIHRKAYERALKSKFGQSFSSIISMLLVTNLFDWLHDSSSFFRKHVEKAKMHFRK